MIFSSIDPLYTDGPTDDDKEVVIQAIEDYVPGLDIVDDNCTVPFYYSKDGKILMSVTPAIELKVVSDMNPDWRNGAKIKIPWVLIVEAMRQKERGLAEGAKDQGHKLDTALDICEILDSASGGCIEAGRWTVRFQLNGEDNIKTNDNN